MCSTRYDRAEVQKISGTILRNFKNPEFQGITQPTQCKNNRTLNADEALHEVPILAQKINHR
jgi:hypothetical protein